jgi:SAM-dependent methyltransferase
LRSIGNSVLNGNRALEIFIPYDPKSLNKNTMVRYLRNIEVEIERKLFTQTEILLLKDALYGKFLDRARRPFFLYHFLPLWEQSVHVLFQDNAHPKIVELGCGTGTSSLLFALFGATVIGIEMIGDLVNICNKRKRFYGEIQHEISAKFYEANAFDFPYQNYQPIDAFFSVFAFNLMKPSNVLLERIIPYLKTGGKVVIVDGNSSSIYSQLIPSWRRPGVLSPIMMKQKLEELGCRTLTVETHCALPPFIFHFAMLKDIAIKIEQGIKFFGLHKHFGVSYTIVSEKV